jgi:hypothetical protein
MIELVQVMIHLGSTNIFIILLYCDIFISIVKALSKSINQAIYP